MIKDQLQDKCRGSLVGGAVGDALGYAVEFDSLIEIRRKYGEGSIRNYELENGVAVFSDDTQMSLFTAEGLLNGRADGAVWDTELLPYIKDSYIHWYYTQTMSPLAFSSDWLTHINNLWKRRAPGNTCMSALSVLSTTDSRPVANISKGCGGVMRVAPIGIYSAAHNRELDMVKAGFLAGAAADLTHKHPLSTFASMALAMIVADCINHEKIDREKFRFIVILRVFKLLELQYKDDDNLQNLKMQVEKALDLAESDVLDTDGIRKLGEGWVGDEALAIAVYCVMRYIDDFQKCIVCAVNHDGDSDSTGAIAGNIIGAILGYSKIPLNYLTTLELRDVLVSVADDMCGCSSDEQMTERYKNHKPFGVNTGYLIE